MSSINDSGELMSTKSVPSKIKAVLFDLDGVLTDTAEYHFLAWKQLADELEIPFDRAANERLKGVSRMDSLELILKIGAVQVDEGRKAELADRKNGFYLTRLKTMSEKDLLPNARELLQELREHGLKIALVSASKNAPEVLSRLGIADSFDFIVDPSTLVNGKPDPEIFLRGAEGLGLRPEECVGIEDAEVGIEGIKSAGMPAIGINVQSTVAIPDLAVMSLLEVSVDTILALGSNALTNELQVECAD
jgi:beta-phosphoglucomutase